MKVSKYIIYMNLFLLHKKKWIEYSKTRILLTNKRSLDLRTNLNDLMSEVFHEYSSEKQTFFVLIQILDLYIYQIKKNINWFKSSFNWYNRYFNRISIWRFIFYSNELINKIGYKLFTKNEILNNKIEIISTIGFHYLIQQLIILFQFIFWIFIIVKGKNTKN